MKLAMLIVHAIMGMGTPHHFKNSSPSEGDRPPQCRVPAFVRMKSAHP